MPNNTEQKRIVAALEAMSGVRPSKQNESEQQRIAVSLEAMTGMIKPGQPIFRYATVADMQADESLNAGDVCQTIGYYSPNDGGGAHYVVTDDGTANDIDIIGLDNQKCATIVQGCHVDIRQYGCKANDATFDNSGRLNRLFATKPSCTVIPSGTFHFSSTIFTKGNIECASDGILCAENEMLYGVVLCSYATGAEMYENINGYIRLRVDANQKAKIGVALARAKQAHIDVEVDNPVWAAFRDRYATEEQFSIEPATETANGVFNANENNINVLVIGASDGSSVIGAWINSSDNTYENIITKDVSVGVYTANAIVCAKSLHSWLSNTDMWNDSTCFYSHGSGAQLCINEVYQDTVRFGVLGSGAGSIQYYLHYLNTNYIPESALDQAESYIAVRNRNSIILNIDTYQTSLQRSRIPKIPPNGNLTVSSVTKTINVTAGESVTEPESQIPITILPYERYRVTASGNVSTVRSLYYYDKFGNKTRYGGLTPDTAVIIMPEDFVDKLTVWVDADAVTSSGTLTLTVEKIITPVDGKMAVTVNTMTPKAPPTLDDLNNASVGGVYTVAAGADNAPITTTGNEQLICQYLYASRSQTLLTGSGAYYRLGTQTNSEWAFGNWIQIS